MATSDPVYLRVVADIRRQIVDGTLPPGASIPSRAQLTRKYGVGETAARHALRVLAAEGLIVGRVGSGHYVRDRPVLLPLHRWRFHDHHAPFGADVQSQGTRATWDWRTEPAEATPDIAQRLRLDDSAPVTRTHYVFRGDGRPVQLATSYEPAEFGESPTEESPRGLVARLSALGVKVTEIVEQVYTRVPQPAESDTLALPAGVHVLHVERTHWAGDRPVETSDIVIPGDRFRLVYAHSLQP
ncbi:GntR family transcriptional regulator [Streptosporangium roseum]|uniref:Transcriptional regulator, GntR family n=1 Tax=Streptosporangium roseum (strain ATCC 12428 / DSM 43021 / JCM 3005 / KCTC 9067 / NCIMB 10171 / NRRL 2505 / NI 9100) TaxID=479432 RepID=D2AXX9_STRRD|nr:GntR family transcriptional regulator [Streptosporangium roseum]ACZ85150.1 putative transcriptional regulator, GntR family [Streptosporangium roseum DSM 43021]